VKKKVCILAAALFCLLLGWELYRSNRVLTVEYEQISTELVTGKVRVVHLSDLHNAQFGENNEKLLKLLRQSEPDIIAITGDLVDSRRTDTAVALAFLEEAGLESPFRPGRMEELRREFEAYFG
jgi:predicted MPP superfamily phosphohydrolase